MTDFEKVQKVLKEAKIPIKVEYNEHADYITIKNEMFLCFDKETGKYFEAGV